MATIRQEISNLRTLIRKVQDDSPYEDQFLYSLLTIVNSKLTYQHTKMHDNDFHWTTFCIPLEVAKSHNCDCVEVGCNVLKSVHKIPHALNGKGGHMFKVETLGDILISPKSPQTVIDDQLDDIKRGKLGWYLRSGKLIIWNNLKLKAVQVSGRWEDITKWQGITLCDENGDEMAQCYDIMDEVFHIDDHLRFDTYRMVLTLLRLPLSILEDQTSDNNPNITT